MAQELSGKRVAIVATDGFEQAELTEPMKALQDAGAKAEIVSPKSGQIQGWQHFDKADFFKVDKTVDQASPEDYDALMLPGGVANPDQLRLSEKTIQFIKSFVDAKKPIAAICHGPWTLIDAGAVRGRKMTSWPSLKADLQNAGAQWVDQEVVTDQGLVTSRKPDDIPAFNRKMIEEFAEGMHARRKAEATA
ncbi:MAG TPA: type 1 glutamine amidotransferase domain-containing protein [Alphaproteobacteria bacterium]|nr:type 1 glutamine amidotransferase domain-containing protein [Alphaproteobacteria bacterium]